MKKLRQIFLLLSLLFHALSASSAWAQSQVTPAPAPNLAPTRAGRALEPRGPETLRKITFTGLNGTDEATAADVAGLHVGEEFSPDRLENSINSLRKWGIFSKVEVLVQHEDSSAELNYDLEEGYIIKDVKMSGNYPLLEREVRRTLFLSAGEVFEKSRMEEQLDRLDRLYVAEGYFDTTVLAVEDYNEAKHEVTLYFKIQKGKTYHIRNTQVEGNTALNPKRIRTIIFTYSHYKPKQIKKDLAKIQGLYKKKGFIRARVRLEGETYDYDARKVDINVAIRQGKKIFVEFEGNEHFWEKTLRKQLPLVRDGDFDDYELDASKTNLLTFYKLRGFDQTQVEWVKEKIDAENFLVTFKIQEGPQRVIKNIEFVGAHALKPSKLKDLMISKKESIGEKGYFIQPLFEADLKLLEDQYQKEGYIDAKIESWEKSFNEVGDRMILTVKIAEKEKNFVEETNLLGLSDSQKDKIVPRLISRPGEPYSPTRVEQDRQYILVQLSNTGYPYAQVEKEMLPLPDHRWKVNFKVTPGAQVTIGRLLFVGNALTKEKVLRKNLRFEEGSVFSAQALLQSQINLRRLGIFDRVAVETLGLANKEPVVQALISVQEKKSKIIDLEAGYNTDTGFTGKLIFNKLNMWGSGKNGNIKLQAGQEISRFELNYVDPRLRGTSLQLLVGAFTGFERLPFFQNFSTGTFASLFKDFGPHLNAYGRLQFDFVNFDESKTVVSQLQPGESTQDHTRIASTVGVSYDQRNNFGNPTSGYFLGSTLTFTKQFVQRDGKYLTARATLGDWWSPFRKVTIANSLRVAQIFPLPGDINTIPVDDRLYLGGDDTVRGFCQDCLLSTGGLFALVHNLEIQINPFNHFQLVGFLDTGIVIDSLDQFNLYNLRHSAGPGIRYLTPVGPIRLEYGLKLDPHPGESLGKVTFSFGYFF